MRMFVLAAAAVLPMSAFAGDGDDILKKMDFVLENFQDQSLQFRVEAKKVGTDDLAVIEFDTKVKDGHAFLEFTAPGDLKGMRVLTLSPTEIWTWLPEFGKIRRVASHSLGTGFMGTTLSQSDMGTFSFGKLYDATIIGEDAASWTLSLQARDPKTVVYQKLSMVIDKKMLVPTKIEYFGDNGQLARVQERTGYTCPKPDYCMFGQMKMTDVSTGAWSKLILVSSKIDTGVSADIFTPRTLQMGL